MKCRQVFCSVEAGVLSGPVWSLRTEKKKRWWAAAEELENLELSCELTSFLLLWAAFFSMFIASIWLRNDKLLVFSITCWYGDTALFPITTWPWGGKSGSSVLLPVCSEGRLNGPGLTPNTQIQIKTSHQLGVDLGVQSGVPDQVDDPALRLLRRHVELICQHAEKTQTVCLFVFWFEMREELLELRTSENVSACLKAVLTLHRPLLLNLKNYSLFSGSSSSSHHQIILLL